MHGSHRGQCRRSPKFQPPRRCVGLPGLLCGLQSMWLQQASDRVELHLPRAAGRSRERMIAAAADSNVYEGVEVGMERQPALHELCRHSPQPCVQEQGRPRRIRATPMSRRQTRCPRRPRSRGVQKRLDRLPCLHETLLSASSFKRPLIVEISTTHRRRSTCSRFITSPCGQWK
jgi:hypothetical protein